MKAILMLLLVALFAGCADPEPTQGSDDLPAPVETTAPEPQLTLVVSAATGDGTVTISGTVNVPAAVTATLRYGDALAGEEALDADGNWNVTLPLPYGRSQLIVVADDGITNASHEETLERFGQVGLQVVYRGDGDLKADRDDTFDMLNNVWPSEALYEGCETGHPGYYTAHDAMLDWQAATGVDVEYSDCGGFGFGVNAIDGHENPGFWCFTVNGEAAEVGISLQSIEVGDVLAWDDCALVLG